jgi:hypothetical protein
MQGRHHPAHVHPQDLLGVAAGITGLSESQREDDGLVGFDDDSGAL